MKTRTQHLVVFLKRNFFVTLRAKLLSETQRTSITKCVSQSRTCTISSNQRTGDVSSIRISLGILKDEDFRCSPKKRQLCRARSKIIFAPDFSALEIRYLLSSNLEIERLKKSLSSLPYLETLLLPPLLSECMIRPVTLIDMS